MSEASDTLIQVAIERLGCHFCFYPDLISPQFMANFAKSKTKNDYEYFQRSICHKQS